MRVVKNTTKGIFETFDVDMPHPDKDQILIRIIQCGICGSDIQIYHGLHPCAKTPLIMGHECVAEVAEVGREQELFSVGDLVTVQPQVFCHTCHACRVGHTNVCENMKFMGVHIDGFFAEYALVPAWNVLKLDKNMNRDAAMLAEPVAVTVHAAKRGGVKPGMRVVVIGAGTIGNLTAQVCRLIGAKVMITDIQDSKLKIAAKCKIDFCVNTSRISLMDGILQSFDGQKADVIIDCAAASRVFPEIMECATGGTEVVLVGNYKELVKIDLTKIQRREIDLYGVMQYNRDDFADAISYLEKGKILTEHIITKHYPLDKVGEAFAYIDEHPDTMKIAIDVGQEECDESKR